jgi:hypothetical protein
MNIESVHNKLNRQYPFFNDLPGTVFTASVGWCPLYLPFRISTCKTDDKQTD